MYKTAFEIEVAGLQVVCLQCASVLWEEKSFVYMSDALHPNFDQSAELSSRDADLKENDYLV